MTKEKEEAEKKASELMDAAHNLFFKEQHSTEEKFQFLFGINGIYCGKDAGINQRWLSTGDVVEFVPYKIYSTNGEFKINGDDNWFIWFSQLNEYLYDGTPEIKCSVIIMKNGQNYFIPMLNIGKFMEITRNKKFSVTELDYKTYGPVKDNPVVQKLQTYKKVYDYVSDMMKQGRFKEVKGMLKPRRAYAFIEV